MIRTSKSFCRLSLIVWKYPPALKTSPCMNLSTALQGKSMYWFSHGTRISEKQLLIWQVILATTSILAYNSGVKLLLVFRWDTTCIFLLLCCTTDGSQEFSTIHQHFCFVILVSRYFFFCFQKNFDVLCIVTWTWSHWCRIIFYFYHSLSWMLYLPCTKRYYWETYCLGLISIFLYSYMLLLELMVAGLSLLFYACWFEKQMDRVISEWDYRKIVPNRKWSFMCMGVENILQSCGLVF